MAKKLSADTLKSELSATVTERTSYIATSKDGKTVAHGKTELEALKLLKKTLASKQQ